MRINEIYAHPSIVRVVDPETMNASFALCCQVCEQPIVSLPDAMAVAYDPSEQAPPIVDHQRVVVTHEGSCYRTLADHQGDLQTNPFVELESLAAEFLLFGGADVNLRENDA